MCVSGHIDMSFEPRGFGTTAEVYCVTKETVARYPLANHTSHYLARMNANSQLEADIQAVSRCSWALIVTVRQLAISYAIYHITIGYKGLGFYFRLALNLYLHYSKDIKLNLRHK